MAKRRVTLDKDFGKRSSTEVLRDLKSAKKSSGGKDAKRAKSDLTDDQREMIRDTFENVYVANRWRIVRMNFLRGVAFGLGTFLGGTIVVAIVVWFLTQTVDLFPWARDFTERIIDSLDKK
jgi:hypothetical protein